MYIYCLESLSGHSSVRLVKEAEVSSSSSLQVLQFLQVLLRLSSSLCLCLPYNYRRFRAFEKCLLLWRDGLNRGHLGTPIFKTADVPLLFWSETVTYLCRYNFTTSTYFWYTYTSLPSCSQRCILQSLCLHRWNIRLNQLLICERFAIASCAQRFWFLYLTALDLNIYIYIYIYMIRNTH